MTMALFTHSVYHIIDVELEYETVLNKCKSSQYECTPMMLQNCTLISILEQISKYYY